MKALVTGATGFLGRSLVAELRGRGVEVTALGSKDADLRDPSALDRFAATKFDRIFHLAVWTEAADFSIYHPGEEWLINQQINVTTLRFWAMHQPRAKLVALGTSSAYHEGLDLRESDYLTGIPIPELYTFAMTKRMMQIGLESLARQFGMKYLTVIPSTLYGPIPQRERKRMHFVFDLAWKVLDAKHNGAPIVLWGDGNQRRELIHVEDFVRETLALDEVVENEIVNVGAGEDHSIREFATLLCECAGVDPAVIQYDTARFVGARLKRLSIAKLEGLLPNRSRIPLRDGLAALLSSLEPRFVDRPAPAGG